MKHVRRVEIKEVGSAPRFRLQAEYDILDDDDKGGESIIMTEHEADGKQALPSSIIRNRDDNGGSPHAPSTAFLSMLQVPDLTEGATLTTMAAAQDPPPTLSFSEIFTSHGGDLQNTQSVIKQEGGGGDIGMSPLATSTPAIPRRPVNPNITKSALLSGISPTSSNGTPHSSIDINNILLANGNDAMGPPPAFSTRQRTRSRTVAAPAAPKVVNPLEHLTPTVQALIAPGNLNLQAVWDKSTIDISKHTFPEPKMTPRENLVLPVLRKNMAGGRRAVSSTRFANVVKDKKENSEEEDSSFGSLGNGSSLSNGGSVSDDSGISQFGFDSSKASLDAPSASRITRAASSLVTPGSAVRFGHRGMLDDVAIDVDKIQKRKPGRPRKLSFTTPNKNDNNGSLNVTGSNQTLLTPVSGRTHQMVGEDNGEGSLIGHRHIPVIKLKINPPKIQGSSGMPHTPNNPTSAMNTKPPHKKQKADQDVIIEGIQQPAFANTQPGQTENTDHHQVSESVASSPVVSDLRPADLQPWETEMLAQQYVMVDNDNTGDYVPEEDEEESDRDVPPMRMGRSPRRGRRGTRAARATRGRRMATLGT